MSKTTIDFRSCPCGVKRGYDTEDAARKALGKVRTKRNRAADRRGTRRGIALENRYYECNYGSFHLTSQSRSEYAGGEAWR
jgi:hypothetical protein